MGAAGEMAHSRRFRPLPDARSPAASCIGGCAISIDIALNAFSLPSEMWRELMSNSS
jgi:hypothetical protein